MTEKQFTIVREFDAPREALWRAWTDPAVASQWWHPHGVSIQPGSVQIDLREGGVYKYTMVVDETGDSWPAGGTYLSIREPDQLRFTWATPRESVDDPPVVTVDLVDLDGARTEMTFHMQGVDEDRQGKASVYLGWSEAFEVLEGALQAA